MSSFPGPWPLTLVAGGDSPSAVMDFSSIFSSLVSSTAGFSTTSCLFSGLAVLAGQQEGKERDVTRLIGSCPVVCWGPCHDAQSQGRWALPNSVPAQLCPILALSLPSSVPSRLCPHPALSGIQLKSPASQRLSPRLTQRKVPGEPCSVLSRGVARYSPRRQGRRQSGALACLLMALQLELDLSHERLPPPALPSTSTTSHDLPSQ